MTILGAIIIVAALTYLVYAFRPRVDRARVDAEVERQLAEMEARGVVPNGDIWKELGG